IDEAAEGAKVRPIWEQRLIFDAASTTAKLLANVQMEAMRRKPDDAQDKHVFGGGGCVRGANCTGPQRQPRRAGRRRGLSAPRRNRREAIDAFERKLYGRPVNQARGVDD